MRNILNHLLDRNILCLLVAFWSAVFVNGQTAMTNIQGRDIKSLNGVWKVIVDLGGVADQAKVWQDKKPQKKGDFIEYSFDDGPVMHVPGSFNSQQCELTYFEGSVWYKKEFDYTVVPGKRAFVHFGAVNYLTDVYLNGEKLGSHEGGFTPFQFEITGKVHDGKNSLIVRANNQKSENGIPALGYDWFNYGGITRDVNLVGTNSTYIRDYHIQLRKHSNSEVYGWVQLDGSQLEQPVVIKIPELGINYTTASNKDGLAEVRFSAPFELWSPENPKLYKIIVECRTDTVQDEIGFRNIEVLGDKVYLNGNPIFLRGVNIHEENPCKSTRANSGEDASLLLNWAKELGCNLVRLAHYPHNEHMIKLAEEMGLMVWSEIPVYSKKFNFSGVDMPGKMALMMREMVQRDRNRCNVVVWSLSNETGSAPLRDSLLVDLTQKCRAMDSTRLITHVTNNQKYRDNTFTVWDTLYNYSDIISLNEYAGWYGGWSGTPKDTKWKLEIADKPIFISEFGGGALKNDSRPVDEHAFWSEELQEKIYIDQIEMFGTIPGLCGVCPWILVDYRSPTRMQPVYQKGYNRKGLISEKGEKKKAWYVMKQYYENITQ